MQTDLNSKTFARADSMPKPFGISKPMLLITSVSEDVAVSVELLSA